MLGAARVVMLRDGLRGATMEAIAREAGIAKATLYAQFSDKDAVFGALVVSLRDTLLAAFEDGIDSDGSAAERIGSALAAHYLALSQILEGSPHASELMSEHKRLGASLRDTDLAMQDRMTTALAQAGATAPADLARLLSAASYGIALKTRDEETMAAHIRLMCRHVIDGETIAAHPAHAEIIQGN